MGVSRFVKQGARTLRVYGPIRGAKVGSVAFAQKVLGAKPDMTQHRYKLGNELGRRLNFTVTYGPFTGLRLASDSWWSAGDRGSMMLGMYECEVLETLDRWRGLADVFIDVGAADGYYAVGCLRAGIVERAISYEISPDGQAVIAEFARANDVADRIKVLGEALSDFTVELVDVLHEDPSSAILLMDIEGHEFEILSDAAFRRLAGCRMIIELHEYSPSRMGQAEALFSLASRYFSVSVITQGPRNPSGITALEKWSDDDRWLLCSESRAHVMRWLVSEPKS